MAVYHPDRVLYTHQQRDRHLPSLCKYQLDDMRIRLGGCWWRTAMGNHHDSLLYIWVNALNYYDMVYAAVVVWLLTAVILVFTVVQFFVSRCWVVYGQ